MDNTEELTKKTCFVVTPIGNADEPIRRHIDGIINAVIKPAIGEKYEIEVAHEMTMIGSINKQVIEAIYKSDLVIANLTNKNPNVMYELAFRHCLGKPVIQIAEKGTVLPFDIGAERTISYSNDAQGVLDLIDEIKKIEKNIDFENDKQGPIYDILKNINEADSIIEKFGENQEVNGNDTTQLLKYLIDKIDDLDIDKNIQYNISENRGNYSPTYTIYAKGFKDLDNSIKISTLSRINKNFQNNKQYNIKISLEGDYIHIYGYKITGERDYVYRVIDNILRELSLEMCFVEC